MDFPNDEKGDALRRMYNGGDDLSDERIINYSVIFGDEKDAAIFCQRILETHSVTTSLSHYEDEDGAIWDVTVDKFMRPSYRGITDFEAEIEKIASPLNGTNDGWGCVRKVKK